MNPPQETYLLDSYAFHWKDDGIEAIIDRLHEERDGLKCEMTINTSRLPVPGMVREGRFNLSSATTRSSWVKALEDRMPKDQYDIDWYAVMEGICAKSVRRWRQGEPMVDLSTVEVKEEMPYLLHPLVIDGAVSVLFADGASGKSLVALGAALSVATGEEIIPGFKPQRTGPVIYWDWEWDAESHAERLQALCAGLDMETPTGMIFYQREVASVMEAAPRMRKRIAETGAVFVVVDSLGFARGGEPNSADLTTKMFGQFRTLGVPVLALDHVAKDAKDSTHSFGSAYTFNSARMMWRIDSEKREGENRFYSSLVNTKANRKTQLSRGLNIDLQSDEDERLLAVRFEATDWRDVSEGKKETPIAEQIANVITANGGGAMALEDIMTCLAADGCNATTETVRVTLYTRKKRFVKVGKNWGLLVAPGVTDR